MYLQNHTHCVLWINERIFLRREELYLQTHMYILADISQTSLIAWQLGRLVCEYIYEDFQKFLWRRAGEMAQFQGVPTAPIEGKGLGLFLVSRGGS